MRGIGRLLFGMAVFLNAVACAQSETENPSRRYAPGGDGEVGVRTLDQQYHRSELVALVRIDTGTTIRSEDRMCGAAYDASIIRGFKGTGRLDGSLSFPGGMGFAVGRHYLAPSALGGNGKLPPYGGQFGTTRSGAA